MLMSQLKILELFKNNYIQFFDELIDLFPQERDIIIIRLIMNDQISVIDVMSIFIEYLLPHKDMVKNRDDRFFIEKFGDFEDQIFNNHANLFKRLWNSPILDSENKKVFWQYFDVLIKLSEKYIDSNKS